MEHTIPANTSAIVYIPAESSGNVREGKQPAETAKGVKFLRLENRRAVYQIQSGNYNFTSVQ